MTSEDQIVVHSLVDISGQLNCVGSLQSIWIDESLPKRRVGAHANYAVAAGLVPKPVVLCHIHGGVDLMPNAICGLRAQTNLTEVSSSVDDVASESLVGEVTPPGPEISSVEVSRHQGGR